MKKSDLTGQQFGRWFVMGPTSNVSNKTAWMCACDCGNCVKPINACNLKSGKTKSCGCLNGRTRESHGLHDSKTYASWECMIQRCTNPKCAGYPNYGARGISICDRWLKSFEAFLADMGERPNGLELDRIDVNGNYEPDNCRWADRATQTHNRRKRKGCTSQYIGVVWSKSRNKWQAYIKDNGKTISLGTFDDELMAAKAYDNAALSIYGPTANTNF